MARRETTVQQRLHLHDGKMNVRRAAGASPTPPAITPFYLLAYLLLLATTARHASANRADDWKSAVGGIINCFNELLNNSQQLWFTEPFPITKRSLHASKQHDALHNHSMASRVVSSRDLYTTVFPEDLPMPGSTAGKKSFSSEELHGVMAALLSRQVITDRAMYARAVQHPSKPALRAFAAKLLSGEAVTIMVQGTSHAEGHGILTQDRPVFSFPALVLQWVQSIFPNPGHKLVNRARGGVRSHKELDLSGESDLILVEFGCSDEYSPLPVNQNPLRVAYEALLRSMLMLPHKPDLLVLHWWAANTGWAQYYESPQDQTSAIARYYGLPQISWRDAIYELLMRGPERKWENALPGFHLNQLFCDSCGHGNLVAHRYYADLIIEYLMEAVQLQALSSGSIHHDETVPPGSGTLKQAIFPENDQTTGFGSLWWHSQDLAAVVKSPLPAEWSFTNEGRGDKWGYVTFAHQVVLELEVPTSSCKPPVRVMTVGLSFLRSYEHMGHAMVECSGCGCDPRAVDIDSHHDKHMSVDEWHTWSNIALVEPAVACKIRVVTLGGDVNVPGHEKFKVTGASIACLS